MSEQKTNEVDFSVVVPFYNESENAVALAGEIREAIRAIPGVWEVLLVNDGSSDHTKAILDGVADQWPACRILTHEKNQGQAAALLTGLHEARGATIITMDGDGQNVPGDIPELLRLYRASGAGMVVGIRQQRCDSHLRLIVSRWANRIRRRFLRDGVTDSGCALKVFDRAIIPALIPIRTLYSFIPAMAVAAGFTIRQIPVRHRARVAGNSNYNLRIFLWRPFFDMMGMWWYIHRCCKLKMNSLSMSNGAGC